MLETTIETQDGAASAKIFTPASTGEKKAGVILYMDAFGPRPALDSMAERLASAGYAVLVPDLFYRVGDYGPYDVATCLDDEATRAQIMGMVGETTQAMTERDTAAFLDTLDGTGATGPVGVVGYCMGGSRALTAAAAYPERVAAAASIHGGRLAGDAPDSPHLRAGSIAGRVYVGSAGEDPSFPPEQSGRLAQALREGGVDYVIENYVGMRHGWAVPDHKVFDSAGAERHWKRLLGFFAEVLRPA
ncbi:MAG: dienelactone hydrolase family protein [Arenicellales bacterium]